MREKEKIVKTERVEIVKKNILVVEDSALMRRVLCDIMNEDERFQVADTARNGLEAYNLLKQKSYDAVILDIIMPQMDGIELLEKLQEDRIQLPIVIVSTVAKEGAKETLRALELGAFDFVQKPDNLITAKGGIFRDQLVSALVFASNKFNKRTRINPRAVTATEVEKDKDEPLSFTASKPIIRKTKNTLLPGGEKVVALACSTGGPKSLHTVIPLLPGNLNAPVLLVQHMPAGFTQSLAERLNEVSQVTVKEAEDGEILKKGWVYIAPGGKHLALAKRGKMHMIAISDEPPIGGLRPCANVMYRSLIESDFDEIICVVLTGMGSDGTDGIIKLEKKKKIYVIAQDQASSVVYGMPKVITESGLTDQVVALDGIADAITKCVGVR